MLVQMALTSLLRFEHEMVMPPEMKFSKREREILKWTAEGKTSAEIAIILSISENTVNFHQKNMQKKFNAPNKTQIACYAAATGLDLISKTFCVTDEITAECTHPAVFFTGGKLV
jgi:LuxR family transcriptional regulator